jgi:hypothetical protein
MANHDESIRNSSLRERLPAAKEETKRSTTGTDTKQTDDQKVGEPLESATRSEWNAFWRIRKYL